MREHECVVLTSAVPKENLEAGDVGTIVHIHDGERAYEVEFTTLTGDTIAVATLLPAQVRSLGKRDITHVRELQTS